MKYILNGVIFHLLLISVQQFALSQENDKNKTQTEIQVNQAEYKKFPSENILQLSRSGLSNGEILLMNSSHQDLAWMDFLEKCIIERDTMLMTPLLKAASVDHGYRFDIEDVLMVKEYLERHPEARLNEAWQSKIYPDHGWGGKGRESTDAIFLRKFEKSLGEAEAITNEALSNIASRVRTNHKKGIPVLVFNSLSWQRDDPVCFNLGFDPGEAVDIKLVDASGMDVPVQLNDEERYSDNSLKSIKATFISKGVPSPGYKTFYAVPLKVVAEAQSLNRNEKSINRNEMEIPFYRVELGKGGVKSIFDKEINVELLSCKDILGGDVFTLKSVGNGAGEFADV